MGSKRRLFLHASDVTMGEQERCGECGAAMEANPPGGLCPRCLLKLAIGPGADPETCAKRPTPALDTPERVAGYRILGTLGEGGMGIVYLAEQTEPIRRHVALKVMKPGMDSRAVLARFEAERQALAIMSHPGVARVFDAGTTEQGRPYFVMEYVPGVPITEYCDMRCLPVRDRLELFVEICEAIQHAHQKGIVHRDVKPTNVLVSSESGRPVLKVIDFGVAKAMGRQLTERTLFTQQGVVLGTPEYMSPEQAGKPALEVDARTDIYSLGVVLYELLVGALPFDAAMLRHAAACEMLRIIRDEDPPKPTTRFNSLGDTASEVARRRHTDARSLTRLVHGELEWITMRAIEKDPVRRYPTASELAADIRRHLVDEPVLAGPPSQSYRLKKFVRRHRAAVTAVAVSFMVLLAGVLVSTVLYFRSEAARTRAESEAVRNRLDAEAMQAALRWDAESFSTLSEQAMTLHRRALGRGNPALAPYLVNQLTISLVAFGGRLQPEGLDASLREAIRLIDRALDAGDTSAVRTLLLLSETVSPEDGDMAHLYGKALELVGPGAKPPDRDASGQLDLLADLLERNPAESTPEAAMDAAERIAREILALRRRIKPSGDRQLARSVDRLSVLLARKGDFQQHRGDSAGAEASYREALALAGELGPGSELRMAEIGSDLGRCLLSLGRFGEAEALLTGGHRVLWAKREDGEWSGTTQVALNRLVDLLEAWGKPDQAARYLHMLPTISIQEVRDLGAVRYVPQVATRDGGFSASIGGRSVWVFSDTSMSGLVDQALRWRHSSWGRAEPARSDGPPTVAAETDGTGMPLELIPLTAEEAASDTARQGEGCIEDCGSRWSFSPGPVIRDDARNRTLVFYTRKLGPSRWKQRRMGASLALWPIPEAPVVRPRVHPGAGDPTLLFGADEPQWGSGALIVGDALYCYACDCNQLGCHCLLARVPLDHVFDREAWRFYAGGETWDADWRSARPVIEGTSPLSVHWNDYLRKFVAVSGRFLDHRIHVRTADHPEGPWSKEPLVIEGHLPTSGLPWISSVVGHPDLAREGGQVMTLTYVRNIGFFRTETRVLEIEFRKR